MRRCLRCSLLLFGLLLLPDLAIGQGSPPSNGLIGSVLNLVDDGRIQTELKTTADQMKSLLAMRQRGASRARSEALVGWADLKLTDEQKKAIQSTREKARDLARALTDPVGFFPASQAVGVELREKLDAALLAILSPEQTARWSGRGGKPVAGLRLQPVILPTQDGFPAQGGMFGGLP